MILPYLYGAAICMVVVSPSWVSGMQTVVYRDGVACDQCSQQYQHQPIYTTATYTENRVVSRPNGQYYSTSMQLVPSSQQVHYVSPGTGNRVTSTYNTIQSDSTGAHSSSSSTDPCSPSPCGQNTNCKVVNGGAVCSCLSGFIGSPIRGCSHECEQDSECRSNQICKSFECVAACSLCGDDSTCKTVNNHRPVCECVNGYLGGSSQCAPICRSDSDCPRNKPACNYGSCKNPCDGVCGVGANCELKNSVTPVCSCPRDMTGDPFVQCRPFTEEDACKRNPCGVNANCKAGYDRSNQLVPVCSCPTGFNGNALVECRRGECAVDSDCTDDKACIGYECKNPCAGQCGTGAICEPKRHTAVCKCPAGYVGHPFEVCRPKN